VRYDPQNPALVAVDTEPRAAAASSGNPYRDQFQRVTQIGVGMLPPPDEPAVFLGTGDSAADQRALYEHNYAMIGASGVQGGADLAQAVAFGREVEAALVVVYGSFAPPAGTELEILPFRPKPDGRGSAGYGPSLFSNLGADGRVAAYWGRTRPAILGVVFRTPQAEEAARAKGGLAVEAVTDGSPAAAAGFAAGDVVVAIDGEPVGDFLGVPALLRSKAGRSVRFDVVRGGEPLALTADLNPAE
jgi:membrane-associated protease RseP (regulator of RpoE activity)